jgi:hypothetical protein
MNSSMQQFVLNLIVDAIGPILTVVSGRESDTVQIGVIRRSKAVAASLASCSLYKGDRIRDRLGRTGRTDSHYHRR